MDEWDNLVEATINAIQVDAVNKLVEVGVTCLWNGSRKKRIIARGVDDFSVSEMRLSNVVDRATFFRPLADEEDDSRLIRRLFVLLRGQEPSESDLNWPILKNKVARVHSGDLTFLELEPAYGATVTILAQSICLEDV